jgi:hypothetical protein
MNLGGNATRQATVIVRPALNWAARLWMLLAGSLVLLAGCLNDRRPNYDPLLGPGNVALPGRAPARELAARGRGGVPPIPDPFARSNAELTNVPPGQGPGARPGGVAQATENNSGQTSPLTPVGLPDSRSPNPANAALYVRLQQMLRDKGVTWWRLEPVGDTGEYRFSCSVPNRDNPNMARRYEVQAQGDYGIEAIRSVLQQIEREQR